MKPDHAQSHGPPPQYGSPTGRPHRALHSLCKRKKPLSKGRAWSTPWFRAQCAMIDPTTLIPIISGVISASVQIGVAIHRWWKNQRDHQTQHMAFEASRPTSQSASELHSLMDVQSSFWRTNPGMWQALGREAASRPMTD